MTYLKQGLVALLNMETHVLAITIASLGVFFLAFWHPDCDDCGQWFWGCHCHLTKKTEKEVEE